MVFHYQLHGATKQFSFSCANLFPKLEQFNTRRMLTPPGLGTGNNIHIQSLCLFTISPSN